MRRFTIFAIILFLVGVISWRWINDSSPQIARATSTPPLVLKNPVVEITGGGMVRHNDDGFAGCGWSSIAQTSQALSDAASHALDRSAPDLTLVFYNPQHDPQKILDALHQADRPMGKVFGETTQD